MSEWNSLLKEKSVGFPLVNVGADSTWSHFSFHDKTAGTEYRSRCEAPKTTHEPAVVTRNRATEAMAVYEWSEVL